MAVCDAQLELFAFVVVVLVAKVEEVVVVEEGTGRFETEVVGKAVGREVGEPADTGGGEDVPPHPFPTLIATSAQFQNCSGTPRPSEGML